MCCARKANLTGAGAGLARLGLVIDRAAALAATATGSDQKDVEIDFERVGTCSAPRAMATPAPTCG